MRIIEVLHESPPSFAVEPRKRELVALNALESHLPAAEIISVHHHALNSRDLLFGLCDLFYLFFEFEVVFERFGGLLLFTQLFDLFFFVF
jgi:hypothetical protein